MLKVKTLKPVEDMGAPEIILRGDIQEIRNNTAGENVTGIEKLIGKKQNIVIESYGGDEDVRDCITSLAELLVKEDPLMKGFIRKLRQHYCDQQKPFSFSVSAWDENDKKKLREIFEEELCGIVDSVDVDSNPDIITGNLVFSPAAMAFLTGRYMEIGVYEIAKSVMKEIAARCKISWNIYRNVKVTTKKGIPKNEFDVVIECEGIFYVIEVKSGEKFNAWGSLVDSGREYNIVPGRLLLVDSWLSDEKAGRIEDHCQYYVSNLEHDSLRKKILTMITNDLQEEHDGQSS
ncbi:MAG: hypothetical protein Q4F28_10795 [Eubacteriales bacterium]|nr:hypothetical protein [Eubacteriales bacterium]